MGAFVGTNKGRSCYRTKGGGGHLVFSFLLPMAVVVLVVVGTIGLVAREGGKVLDSRDNPPRTDPRAPSRGGELSVAVYWLLMGLFLLASVAMVCFFWLVVRDQWIHHRPLVAGRLDAAESMRVLFLLLATVAVSSGILWRHYRRVAAYGSPLEPFSWWCSRCATGWQRWPCSPLSSR